MNSATTNAGICYWLITCKTLAQPDRMDVLRDLFANPAVRYEIGGNKQRHKNLVKWVVDNMDFMEYDYELTHVKAIFFDFGGTLYELDHSVISAWKNILIESGIGFDETCFFNALKVARSYLDRYTAKKVHTNQIPKIPFNNWVDYHALILRTMGVKEKHLLNNLSLEITQAINNIEKVYEIKKDVRKTLIILKQKYKIGLISNTTTDYRIYLNEDGILHLFDIIGLSCEIGLWKPDKKIFEECCKRAKVDPQNCVYIGDSLICDFKGALDAGMMPILINPCISSSKILRKKNSLIKNIGDLLKIFELLER